MRRAMPFLVIGACLVLVLGWYFMWYSPAGDDVASTKTQAETLDVQSQVLEVQIASLREVADRAPALEARAAELAARIPAETSLDGFIVEANRIASANGIEWVSVSPVPLAGGGPAGTGVIAFSAQANGTYEQLRTYLEELMNGDRLVVIDTVSITPASGSTDEGAAPSDELQVSFDGRMFTSALPEGYVDPNAPATTAPAGDASTSSSNTAARTGAS